MLLCFCWRRTFWSWLVKTHTNNLRCLTDTSVFFMVLRKPLCSACWIQLGFDLFKCWGKDSLWHRKLRARWKSYWWCLVWREWSCFHTECSTAGSAVTKSCHVQWDGSHVVQKDLHCGGTYIVNSCATTALHFMRSVSITVAWHLEWVDWFHQCLGTLCLFFFYLTHILFFSCSIHSLVLRHKLYGSELSILANMSKVWK